MPIVQIDWETNNPCVYDDWDADNQAIGNSWEQFFIGIEYDYNSTKYHAFVYHYSLNKDEGEDQEVVFKGIETRSYSEMKKQLIKCFLKNEIYVGIPTKEDFWDLICKVH
jgi:hypothetical protein